MSIIGRKNNLECTIQLYVAVDNSRHVCIFLYEKIINRQCRFYYTSSNTRLRQPGKAADIHNVSFNRECWYSPTRLPLANYGLRVRDRNAIAFCYHYISVLLSSCLQTLWTETTRKSAVVGCHTKRIPIATRSSYQRTTISTDCSTCNAWTSFALFLQSDLVAASVPEYLSIFLRVYWMVIQFMASRKLLLGKPQ